MTTTGENESKKAARLLSEKHKELKGLLDKKIFDSSSMFHYSFSRWRSEVEYRLVDIFGEDSREVKNFQKSSYLSPLRGTARELAQHRLKAMVRAAAEIEAILSAIKEYGIPERQEPRTPPKVFIAHGGETKSLGKLKSFLDALGIEPLIVEEQAIVGRLTEPQVEHYLQQADCGIALATQGGIIDAKSGSKHPRLNVIDELGRMRNAYPNKTILLLERGTQLPSNVSGIVRISFTQNNIEKAFTKIAKELAKFGIIRAISIRSQSV